MGLFHFLNNETKNILSEPKATLKEEESSSAPTSEEKGVTSHDIIDEQDQDGVQANPEIPEEIFVEYQTPNRKPSMEPQEIASEANNLNKLYDYLGQNLEKKGYEDALTNPDTSYRDEHIRFIHNELTLMLSRVKNYYSATLRTIDLHIETRKRGGMIELVDELLSEKATIEDELSIVNTIEQHSQTGNGLTENLFLSYKKGFRNGFAAITYNEVLTRKQGKA